MINDASSAMLTTECKQMAIAVAKLDGKNL